MTKRLILACVLMLGMSTAVQAHDPYWYLKTSPPQPRPLPRAPSYVPPAWSWGYQQPSFFYTRPQPTFNFQYRQSGPFYQYQWNQGWAW